MASVASEPPSMLARVDRLDIMLGYLEEMRGGSHGGGGGGAGSLSGSGRSPAASTTSSGTVTSDGGNSSSLSSSPASLMRQQRRCRPIDDAVVEAREKGNLIDRIDRLEVRILKLEEEMVLEKREGDNIDQKRARSMGEKRRHGKGLRRLVKSCVNGDLKTKE